MYVKEKSASINHQTDFNFTCGAFWQWSSSARIEVKHFCLYIVCSHRHESH